jgi:hypothetical protein
MVARRLKGAGHRRLIYVRTQIQRSEAKQTRREKRNHNNHLSSNDPRDDFSHVQKNQQLNNCYPTNYKSQKGHTPNENRDYHCDSSDGDSDVESLHWDMLLRPAPGDSISAWLSRSAA